MKSKSGPTAAERASQDGLCHNSAPHVREAKEPKLKWQECLKSAQWLGGTDMPDGSIWWVGVCDECKQKGGDLVATIRHWRPYNPPHKRH